VELECTRGSSEASASSAKLWVAANDIGRREEPNLLVEVADERLNWGDIDLPSFILEFVCTLETQYIVSEKDKLHPDDYGAEGCYKWLSELKLQQRRKRPRSSQPRPWRS